ncbi:hypothetical protein MBANPS3_012610, partial [Mucor bainieri]
MPKSDEDHKIATLDDLVERLTELTIKLNKEEAPTSNLSNAPPRDDNIDSDDEEIDEMSVAAQRRKFNKLDISIYKNATTSLTSLAYIGIAQKCCFVLQVDHFPLVPLFSQSLRGQRPYTR